MSWDEEVTRDLMGGKRERKSHSKEVPDDPEYPDRPVPFVGRMRGKAEATYKRIRWTPGRSGGGRGPTEVERPQGRETEYMGETRGFWLLLLATPHRGRAIPCGSEDDSRPA